jgi:hypothetical protein
MPPLRQAAIPLSASGGQRSGKGSRTENGVQPDKAVELSTVQTKNISRQLKCRIEFLTIKTLNI